MYRWRCGWSAGKVSRYVRKWVSASATPVSSLELLLATLDAHLLKISPPDFRLATGPNSSIHISSDADVAASGSSIFLMSNSLDLDGFEGAGVGIRLLRTKTAAHPPTSKPRKCEPSV